MIQDLLVNLDWLSWIQKAHHLPLLLAVTIDMMSFLVSEVRILARNLQTISSNSTLNKRAFSLELLKAIGESLFFIIILLKNYVSSTWCLDEFVKIGLIVLPNLDPL